MKQSLSFHASGCSDVPWTREWSHVVEGMVDCFTPFQMRVKVHFLFDVVLVVGITNGIESPWISSCHGQRFTATRYTELSTLENSCRSPP